MFKKKKIFYLIKTSCVNFWMHNFLNIFNEIHNKRPKLCQHQLLCWSEQREGGRHIPKSIPRSSCVIIKSSHWSEVHIWQSQRICLAFQLLNQTAIVNTTIKMMSAGETAGSGHQFSFVFFFSPTVYLTMYVPVIFYHSNNNKNQFPAAIGKARNKLLSCSFKHKY